MHPHHYLTPLPDPFIQSLLYVPLPKHVILFLFDN